MLGKIRHFFSEYRQLGYVVISILISLALYLSGRTTIANFILGATAVIAVIPLLWDMIQKLRSGEYGVDLLAATAIITAVILREYWAAIIIVLMLTGGEALEDYAERRAKRELNALLERKPTQAHLVKGKTVKDIAVSAVKVRDTLLVQPGEVIPVDATVLEGTSELDESSLTGEAVPVEKSAGDALLSGSINGSGVLTVRAEATAANSQYEQIIKLVKSAMSGQSPFVRMADRYAVPFTGVAFLIAGAAWYIGGSPSRFLEVLVVATPCPLILGAPIALVSGMSRAAKEGIIVKNGSALEKLAEVRTIAFDKTGTLTEGTPVVDKVVTFNGHKRADVLALAAAIESGSNHILAQAITKYASAQKLKVQAAKQVKEAPGLGLTGRAGGKTVHVGRLSYMNNLQITMPAGFKPSDIKSTATYVAINDTLAAVMTFTDVIRTESKPTLAQLKRAGISHTLMITGDNKTAAEQVAKELGIEDVTADCLPADKLHALDRIKHRPVAFVGDGINDAPILTASDVGIALGARGSTAASESADVVILQDDLNKVASSVAIAKRTFFIAKQSILIGIFISVGLMLVFSTGRFTAVQGALLQEVVDIIVIINALRAHNGGRLARAKA